MLLAGGTAGVAQWIPTYPIDVIKSRVQAAPPGSFPRVLHSNAGVICNRVRSSDHHWVSVPNSVAISNRFGRCFFPLSLVCFCTARFDCSMSAIGYSLLIEFGQIASGSV